MKTILFSLVLFLITFSAFSQSEKYSSTMKDRVAAVDTTNSVSGLNELAAAFERIADAEKNQWHPYYYAAYTKVLTGYLMMDGGMNGGLASTLDPIADKAEQLLNKSEALSKDNSEIFIVKKMIASLRMMADPMSRYMQYGPVAAEALETAKRLNPENPRIYLLLGQDKFYTPEQFGGSKSEAKKLFEYALQKFDAFNPKHSLDPAWGRTTTQYFLSQTK
jgi:hypothetical protein